MAFRTGRTASLPRPRQAAATRELTIPLYLIENGDGLVLMRRERGALMTAMLHLPHGSPADGPGAFEVQIDCPVPEVLSHFLDGRGQPEYAAVALEELYQGLYDGSGAASGEPHPPLAL